MKRNQSNILDRIRLYVETKPNLVIAEGESDDSSASDGSDNAESVSETPDEEVDITTFDGLSQVLTQNAEQCFVLIEMLKDIEGAQGDDLKTALQNIGLALADARDMNEDIKTGMIEYLKKFVS
jgi:hypothetical protein